MNNNRLQQAEERLALINEDGPVGIWFIREEAGILRFYSFRFSTEADARKYIELVNAARSARGLSTREYLIGTIQDLKQAEAKCAKKQRENEAKRYRKFVDEQNEIQRAEIHALEALRKVCLQFDGKVINRRFFVAVEAETANSGFTCDYHKSKESYMPRFDLRSLRSYTDQRIYPQISFYSRVWPWINTRLNAAEAVEMVNGAIKAREAQIAERERSVTHFGEYAETATRLAAQLEKLVTSTNKELVEWSAKYVQSLMHCRIKTAV